MNRPGLRAVLHGRSDRANYAGAGVGTAAGLALWNTRFLMGTAVSGPDQGMVFGALAGATAAVAWLGAGLVACWWFPFPTVLVGTVHYYSFGMGSTVVIDAPTVVAFAAVPAAVLGTVGYLLGTGGRWGYRRVGSVAVRERSR